MLKTFLQTTGECRNVEEIPPAKLEEFLSEFILTVQIKEGKDYEPTSLREIIASFERYLKRKNRKLASSMIWRLKQYEKHCIKAETIEKTRKR